MTTPIRNRIKAHRRVRAGDLVHERLRPVTPTAEPELEALWRSAAEQTLTRETPDQPAKLGPEQFLVLVTCRDGGQQVELIRRFTAEGLQCRALLG